MQTNNYTEAFQLAQKLFASSGKNQKTGTTYNWSIPSIKTCPGATALCSSICYAKRLEQRRPNVAKSWAQNYAISLQPNFPEILTKALRMLPPGLLRIHVGGDFYSPEYIRAWSIALAANPHIKPWCYTRSWRIPELRVAFRTYFGKIPHWLIASTDDETEKPPANWRRSRILIASTQRHARANKPHSVAIAPEDTNAYICPQQRGKQSSCSTCGACGGFRLNADGEIVTVPQLPVEISFAKH